MRTSSLKHRRAWRGDWPQLKLLVAGLVLLGLLLLFVRAGLWQLERADEALKVAVSVAARSEQGPLEIEGDTGEQEALRYRRAIARGTFEPGGKVLLDGRKRAGVNGYHLLVPLRLEGSGMRVFVNLGWRAERADSVIPPAHAAKGVLDRPRVPALRLGSGGSGEVRPYLDLAGLARERGYPVYAYVLVADGPLAEQVLAAGVQRGQKRGMHIGYAIQWFFFALLAAALLGLLMRHGREP